MSKAPSALEAAVQDELVEVIEDLKKCEGRLQALQRRLLVPPTSEGPDERDALEDLRSAIECILIDSLGPAVRDLLAAVAYTLKEPGDP